MTARKNSNAGPHWYEDPDLPPHKQVVFRPLRLTDVPEHSRRIPRQRRGRSVVLATTPTGSRR